MLQVRTTATNPRGRPADPVRAPTVAPTQDLERRHVRFQRRGVGQRSFVANLTVTTMTPIRRAQASCSRPSRGGSPRPCAGVPGTTITVENLFYNVHTKTSAQIVVGGILPVLEVIQR